MKILAISDVVNDKIYSPYIKNIVGDIDIIVSCGDLPMYYLDYVVSMLGKPLYYVCGNHDHYVRRGGITSPVPYSLPKVKAGNVRFKNSVEDYNYNNFGGKNIDGKMEYVDGKIITGLEGSYLYNYGEHQYTDTDMFWKIMGRTPALMMNKLVRGRYLDILITHAPPFGIHDGDDIPHRGFKSYLSFIKRFKPKYLLHGHTHLYDYNIKREDEYYGTKIVNCFDYQILNIE